MTLSEYRVSLEVFSGPLDLLLYLVRKEEVDIYDIPIARITEQYLQYVEMLKRLDIELAGDFLVMAATLMEIKSIMLLPATETEGESPDTMIDPRAELVRQLLEYKRFKDAANYLEAAATERTSRYTRPDTILVGLQPDAEPEVDLDEVSIWTLLEAFDRIMQSVGDYRSYERIEDDTPIDLYQIVLLHRLQTEGAMKLDDIFTDRENRLVMIGMFLALLELIRDQLVAAEQPQAGGGIFLRALTDEPAEDAVRRVIYARTETVEPQEHGAESPGPSEIVVAAEAEDRAVEETSPDEVEIEENGEEHTEEIAAADDETPPSEPKAQTPPIPIRELPARPAAADDRSVAGPMPLSDEHALNESNH
ncbi:MAG TPA: hypothetical protein ENN87_04685 [Phycisphaerales bacterium]|nr:hypothetical protein [Phycisphaerales bacterium]